MTDFSVVSTGYQVEKRSWLQSKLGVEDCDSIVLDISKFTPATHFPNGFIPSGCALGQVSASKLFGPYDPAATDGRQTATHLLFSSATVTHRNGANATQLVTAGLPRGTVATAKLPFSSGAGAVDAAAQAALKFIRFVTAA